MAIVFRSEDHYDTVGFRRGFHGAPLEISSRVRAAKCARLPEAVPACLPACRFSSGNERYRHVTMRIVATRDDNSAAISYRYRSAARVPMPGNAGDRSFTRAFRYRERVCFTVRGIDAGNRRSARIRLVTAIFPREFIY